MGSIHRVLALTTHVMPFVCGWLFLLFALLPCIFDPFLPPSPSISVAHCRTQSWLGLVWGPSFGHAMDELLWRLLFVRVRSHPWWRPTLVVSPAHLVARPVIALPKRL